MFKPSTYCRKGFFHAYVGNCEISVQRMPDGQWMADSRRMHTGDYLSQTMHANAIDALKAVGYIVGEIAPGIVIPMPECLEE